MEAVVLVLTDVQGSTRLWQDEPVVMDAAMARHHDIVHSAVAAHGGWRPVDQGEGDAVFAAFRSATQAVAAVVRVQRELAAEPWPTSTPLRVRIGVHLGEVTERAGNLYGDPVNRCARLRGLGAGGQTLLSSAVYELVRDRLPERTALSDLGEHRMKDLVRPEHVWQLDIDGLPSSFGPLASLNAVLHNLPVQQSALIGRDADVRKVLATLAEYRLVTLTGFGGMGKTRLALQVAAELVDEFPDGVWFVDLADVTEPALVLAAVGRAAGVRVVDGPAVCAALAETRTLFVLDNLEQVLGAASFISALLGAAAGVRVLVTSREPLHVRGEHEIALRPLALPPRDQSQDAAVVSAYAAVQLFIDRACAVREDFTVTNDNAPAVAAICHRLDGHPLAIELAAARVKMMTPQALLPRLDKALSVLTGGSRDMPDRHQTLRATIAWSYDHLTDDEQLLLQRMAVLPADADFAAVEAVCGEGLDVFDVLGSLVDKSLISVLPTETEDRYALLLSIRAFACEYATPDLVEQVRSRHYDWYTTLLFLVPPISRADHARQYVLRIREFDHLAAAWEFALSAGDRVRLRDFPADFASYLIDDVGDVSRGVAVLEQIVASSDQPTTDLFFAQILLLIAERGQGAVIGPHHDAAMHATARALNRTDVDLYVAALDRVVSNGGDDEIRAHIQHMQQLVRHVSHDSPYGADSLHDLVDGIAAQALRDIDPIEALLAARRHDASESVVNVAARLAAALALVGHDAEVVKRFGAQVEAGVPRHRRSRAFFLAFIVAGSTVALGDPARALAMLRLWTDYIAHQPDKISDHARQLEAYALLELGQAGRALEVLDAISRENQALPGNAVLLHRAQRLASGATATEPIDATLEAWLARLPSERTRATYLSLLVERALREPDRDRRLKLAKQAEHERGPICIPWGYQPDLERLLADV